MISGICHLMARVGVFCHLKKRGKMNKKPGFIKTILIALIIALLVSVTLVYFQLKGLKKSVEDNYKSMHGKLSAKIFNSGYDYYITEDEDVNQLKCHLSNMVEGINFSTINMPFTHSLVTTDIYRYYDSELNSIMLKDTLIMVEKESPDSKKCHYYTFKDDAFTKEIDEIVSKYGDKIGSIVFNIKDIYVKDDSFVPAEISCYYVTEGGQVSKSKTLYEAPKSKTEMENNGYSFIVRDDSFFLGSSATGDKCFVYCYGLDSERENMVNDVFNEAVNNSGGNPDNVYVRKDPGPFTVELYSVRKNDGKDAKHTYYVMAYEYMNVLIQPYLLSALGGRGILYVELFVFEVFFIFVFSIIIAFLIERICYRKVK